MDYEEFESELGNIAISESHIEREDSDSHWIEDKKEEGGLARHVHFSEIEEVQYEIGSVLHAICLNVEGEWKKLYFRSKETAQEVLKTLEYRLKAFRQNYG